MAQTRILMFLVTALSMTQIRVVGYIGISELAMLLLGPVFLVQQWENMKRDGFLPVIMLAAGWCVSAVITDWYRQTALNDALKGLASPLSVMMMIPCMYTLLRKDMRVVKWAIVGFTVTTFLSTFVIQPGTSVELAEMRGVTAREAALDYKLTYMSLVLSVLKLIPAILYLQLPIVSILVTLGMALFGLLEGGRSAFLSLMLSMGMMIAVMGRKDKIKRVSRIYMPMMVMLLFLAVLAKEGYKYAVTSGMMGDDELKKYEMQSSTKIGILGGRSQFVAVFFAVKDSPLLGHGSWALDYKGYGVRAAELVGDDMVLNAYYGRAFISLIPGHSHIFTAYVWHGLMGAIFWIYVLYIIYQTFRRHLGVHPWLYGYLALVLPARLWEIFFSPFGARVTTTFTIVVCLMLRSHCEEAKKRKLAGIQVPQYR